MPRFDLANTHDAKRVLMKANASHLIPRTRETGIVHIELPAGQTLIKSNRRWHLHSPDADVLTLCRFLPNDLRHVLLDEHRVEPDRDELGFPVWPWEDQHEQVKQRDTAQAMARSLAAVGE